MKNKIKIFHAQDWTYYSKWLDKVEYVDKLEEADLIFFEGGSDVTPKMYGQPKHRTTQNDEGRDIQEKEMYLTAQKLGIPCIGVCRGSQFLTAMQVGGMLVQDQPNPGNHLMTTFDGQELRVTSTHHQAMYPYNMDKDDYKILGWTENMLAFHKGGNDEELAPEKECEIVYYPKTNCLAIQEHPEMMGFESETNIWLRGIFTKFMKKQL